ncbi:MAG: YiiX/YebB-like N1pC/P60 family cysteine hydrolase [bacterium]
MFKFVDVFTRWHCAVLERLDAPVKGYEQRIYNNFENLYKHICKGDVVLVEGRSKLSKIIKLFTNSHWSHNAFYVGDELIKKGRPFREQYLTKFGDDAGHLVIEAFAGKGVIAAPLRKYQDYNMRVCRPFAIRHDDLQTVVETIIGNLGKHYDQKNIIDIALMLLPSWLNPFKKRSLKACLGNCNDFQVICSGMTAQAFQKVGYPIVPGLRPYGPDERISKKNPYGTRLVMRHYSQVLPRDFDLSPNFEIIKFNIIAGGKFDYKAIPWAEEDHSQQLAE